MKNLELLPRFIRANQAHLYLGMSRDVFNRDVRPFVNEFPIGTQGIAFCRLELDAWADQYILEKSNKNKPKLMIVRGEKSCQKQSLDYIKEAESGTLTSSTAAKDYLKALARVKEKKLRNS